MPIFGFETLLKEKDLRYADKWSPTSVSKFSSVIKKGILKEMDDSLCKNISYSLQYLQYIDFQLRELNLHSMIKKMLYKTFIITSVSIVEAIFYHILKENNQHKTLDEELVLSTKSNKKKYNDNEYLVETNIYKIVEPKEIEMTFDMMIKKMENKKYLDLNHKYFPYLKHFRNLRNRVHIHITEGNKYETDYWTFDEADFLFAKYMLLHILTDNNVCEFEIHEETGENLIPEEYNFLVIGSNDKRIIKTKYGM